MEPTAKIRSPRMATASTEGRAESAVKTLPLNSTISAGACCPEAGIESNMLKNMGCMNPLTIQPPGKCSGDDWNRAPNTTSSLYFRISAKLMAGILWYPEIHYRKWLLLEGSTHQRSLQYSYRN